MFIFKSPRNYIELISLNFFPYINRWKESKLLEVSGKSLIEDSRLMAFMINSLLDDLELYLKKRSLNTTKDTVKIELSTAHGICLLKTLLALPIDENNVYENMVRQYFITELHMQLCEQDLKF